MKYAENESLDFRKVQTIETEDLFEFQDFLSSIPEQTPIAWFSHKDEKVHQGVWIRRGRYRLKHGSFVDPSDLSCYAAQYYEPFGSGRHNCLQIGRSPIIPDDGIATPAVQDLQAALYPLAPFLANAEDEESADDDEQNGSKQGDLKLLQPDSAFELQGALTRIWCAHIYEAEVEGEEEPAQLLVFA